MPKQFRRNQHTLHVAATPAEWLRIQTEATVGVTRPIFSAAAILWFETLEREEQVRRVWKVVTSGQKRSAHNFQVLAWVGERFRTWHWPVATASQVLLVALLGFLDLPPEEREAWFLETLNPVGAPAAKPVTLCAS